MFLQLQQLIFLFTEMTERRPTALHTVIIFHLDRTRLPSDDLSPSLPLCLPAFHGCMLPFHWKSFFKSAIYSDGRGRRGIGRPHPASALLLRGWKNGTGQPEPALHSRRLNSQQRLDQLWRSRNGYKDSFWHLLNPNLSGISRSLCRTVIFK